MVRGGEPEVEMWEMEEKGQTDEEKREQRKTQRRRLSETKRGEENCLADGAETFREDEGIKSESDRLSVLERGMIEDRPAGFWW